MAAHGTRVIGRQARLAVMVLLASLGVSLGAVTTANAQQGTVILAPGNAAVTGFSGALPPAQISPGANPAEQTFIDLAGPSLRIFDLHHMGGPPDAQLVAAPKLYTWFANQIGQVFAVTVDEATPANIYVAATSAYGLPIVAHGPDGKPRHIKVGALNAAFMPGLWGVAAPNGGPGSIWKIDGTTGAVRLFANVSLDGRVNSGAALGGLAFDAESKSLFVADRETGFILRFGMNGTELGRYDHGVTGRDAVGLAAVAFDPARRLDITSPQFDSSDPATWNYAAPERRIFGLAVHRGRLYYAVAAGLQIWSVGFAPDGSFGTDARIEIIVPPGAGPTEISKISFDEQDRMFIAERPEPTGAYDLEAVTPAGIGRVLRYASVGTGADGRSAWQEVPDEFAIGFPLALRNGNGGVAIGYNYNRDGEIIPSSCGGFVWATGEQLRKSPDAALAARLAQSGAEAINGLQGNGTWLIRRDDKPPLLSYFIDYADEFNDDAARGYLGDIAIVRNCTPRRSEIMLYPPGAPPRIATPGPPRPTPPGSPPGNPPGTPPGSCPSGESRDRTGSCQCTPPNVRLGQTCCNPNPTTASLSGACSTGGSGCGPGQTAVGPGNFCCNNGQIYNAANGSPACCLSGHVANGQCQQGPPGPTPVCAIGYVPVGNSCCLSSQMTSTGICCSSGQAPSGSGNSQCGVKLPPIHIGGPQCCATGSVPAGISGKCCPIANVTNLGYCCSGPVGTNRSSCPETTQSKIRCPAGYTRMPDGNCCNNRFVSPDGMSCNAGARPCAPGEFRELSGACVPILTTCPPGEAQNREGVCVPVRAPHCPAGEVRDRRGNCVAAGPPPRRLRPEKPRHPLAPRPPRRTPGRHTGPFVPPHSPIFRAPPGRRPFIH